MERLGLWLVSLSHSWSFLVCLIFIIIIYFEILSFMILNRFRLSLSLCPQLSWSSFSNVGQSRNSVTCPHNNRLCGFLIVISVASNLMFVSSLFLPQHLFNLSKRRFLTSPRAKARKFLSRTKKKTEILMEIFIQKEF